MMTAKYVKQKVAEIAACKDDDESAHSAEDRLFIEVLREIAKGEIAGGPGSSEPWELAQEALKTLDIEFSRWCA